MADRLGRPAVALLAAVLLGGAVGCGSPAAPVAPAPPPAPGAVASPGTGASPEAGLRAPPEAAPLTVQVPSIGVRTDGLVALGLTTSGEMEVPVDAVTAGWLRVGPTPGEVGPTVIAAHVDYKGVPGVFHRLHGVRPGDEIAVERADGVAARFSAYRVERFPKSRFPGDEVYGNTDSPELRLITCGGDFDRATRNYLDNMVLFARLAGTAR